MDSYDVRLIKSVTHRLEAMVSVVASSEEEARAKALEHARVHGVDWSEPLAEVITETDVSIDRVEAVVDVDDL